MKIETKLKKLCDEKGLSLIAHGEGHYTIIGEKRVDYWPDSRRRTAFIVNDQSVVRFATPEQAVSLAGKPKSRPVLQREQGIKDANPAPNPGLIEAAKSILRKHGLMAKVEE